MMTKSEEIKALIADMTENECRELGRLLTVRADTMRNEEIEKAKEEFIKAYRKFRELAPNAPCLITVETDDYDVDLDLYEYMDNIF